MSLWIAEPIACRLLVSVVSSRLCCSYSSASNSPFILNPIRNPASGHPVPGAQDCLPARSNVARVLVMTLQVTSRSQAVIWTVRLVMALAHSFAGYCCKLYGASSVKFRVSQHRLATCLSLRVNDQPVCIPPSLRVDDRPSFNFGFRRTGCARSFMELCRRGSGTGQWSRAGSFLYIPPSPIPRRPGISLLATSPIELVLERLSCMPFRIAF
jgi:hypothetical protein